MTQSLAKILSSKLLLALLLMFASMSWGSVTACSTAANGSTFSSFGPSNSGDGCAEIDKSFTSLTAVSGPILATDLQLWATGTAPSGNTINPVVANFDTTGSANTWSVNGKLTQTSSFSYVVDANTGGSFTGGTYPSPTTGFVWAMNSLTFVPTGAFSSGTGTETIAMLFCLGQATTAGCAAANQGTITATFTDVGGSTPTFSCTVGTAGTCVSPTGNVVNGFSFTEVSVLDTISLSQTQNGNGHIFTLSNIETDFGEFAEAPEPSTFAMIGTALAGVAFLRFRKKKLAPLS
jgi:hypothetical protein